MENFSVTPQGISAWSSLKDVDFAPVIFDKAALAASNAVFSILYAQNRELMPKIKPDWSVTDITTYSSGSSRMSEIAAMNTSDFAAWVNTENETEWKELCSLQAATQIKQIIDDADKFAVIADNDVAVKYIAKSLPALFAIIRINARIHTLFSKMSNRTILFDVGGKLCADVFMRLSTQVANYLQQNFSTTYSKQINHSRHTVYIFSKKAYLYYINAMHPSYTTTFHSCMGDYHDTNPVMTAEDPIQKERVSKIQSSCYPQYYSSTQHISSRYIAME